MVIIQKLMVNVIWLKCCRYGVKHYPINQSINQSKMNPSNSKGTFWKEH